MPYQYNPSGDGLTYAGNVGDIDQSIGNFNFNWLIANTTAPLVLSNGIGIICYAPTLLTITLANKTSNTSRTSRIIGNGPGLWQINLTKGQTIRFGNSLCSSSIAATDPGDALELVYLGNNSWAQASSVGNLNLT